MQTEFLMVELDDIDLRDPIGLAIECSLPAARLREVQLLVKLEPSLAHVQADAMRIEQVMMNLIGYALDLTPPGGCVEVSAHADRDLVNIIVCSSGSSIPDEQLSRIFEPFVQLESDGLDARGMGLGLSVARRLVESHAGTLTAECSGKGLGVTFHVRLPMSSSRAPTA
jgi:signal transduction histidine kinase